MTIRITINDQNILAEEGDTILDSATKNGIVIPTLCHHKDLTPVGSCRLCVVEVEKFHGLVAACNSKVTEGLVIHTETPYLVETRKEILGLLLRNYKDLDCKSTDNNETEFEKWVRIYNVGHPSGEKKPARFRMDADPNPFIRVDFNKCILCTRCVRACEEIQGRFVWYMAERGNQTRIIAGSDTPLLEARCESCGACVAYCPTGALDNKIGLKWDCRIEK